MEAEQSTEQPQGQGTGGPEPSPEAEMKPADEQPAEPFAQELQEQAEAAEQSMNNPSFQQNPAMLYFAPSPADMSRQQLAMQAMFVPGGMMTSWPPGTQHPSMPPPHVLPNGQMMMFPPHPHAHHLGMAAAYSQQMPPLGASQAIPMHANVKMEEGSPDADKGDAAVAAVAAAAATDVSAAAGATLATKTTIGGKSAKKTVKKAKATAPKSATTQARKKDIRWLESLEQLRSYKKEFGDCIVPRGYSANPRLASWVAEQRKQHKLLQDGKQSSITPERIKLLDELGFAWNAQVAAWVRHMNDLKAFKAKTGHCHVPLNATMYPKLGLWVKEQRRHYTLLQTGKPSHMTAARAKELDELGFCWDTHEATWLERLRELSQYKDKHGDCLVPANYEENPRLATWVNHQRRQHKKFVNKKPCHITKERIASLDKIGFSWKPKKSMAAATNYASSSDEEEDDGSAASSSSADDAASDDEKQEAGGAAAVEEPVKSEAEEAKLRPTRSSSRSCKGLTTCI